MTSKVYLSGQDFGTAICEHFGLPPDQVATDIQVYAGPSEVFGFACRTHLTADDLAAIADKMPGRTAIKPQPATVGALAIKVGVEVDTSQLDAAISKAETLKSLSHVPFADYAVGTLLEAQPDPVLASVLAELRSLRADTDAIRNKELIVRPGDTLIINVEKAISDAHRANMIDAVRANVPDGLKIMVLDGGSTATVLRRADPQDRTDFYTKCVQDGIAAYGKEQAAGAAPTNGVE